MVKRRKLTDDMELDDDFRFLKRTRNVFGIIALTAFLLLFLLVLFSNDNAYDICAEVRHFDHTVEKIDISCYDIKRNGYVDIYATDGRHLIVSTDNVILFMTKKEK